MPPSVALTFQVGFAPFLVTTSLSSTGTVPGGPYTGLCCSCTDTKALQSAVSHGVHEAARCSQRIWLQDCSTAQHSKTAYIWMHSKRSVCRNWQHMLACKLCLSGVLVNDRKRRECLLPEKCNGSSASRDSAAVTLAIDWLMPCIYLTSRTAGCGCQHRA